KQRFTAADWEARVREWERSGLSGVEFSRRVGVSPGVLYAWKHRLRRKPGAGAKSPTGRKAPRFVEVEVVATVISDNYSCRATTITPAGRRRPDGSCDAA